MKQRDRVEQLELALNEEKKFRNEIELAQRIIRVGLEALALRMLTTFVLVSDCVVFAWAMASGGWLSLATASIYAIATWCVLYLRPPERKEHET